MAANAQHGDANARAQSQEMAICQRNANVSRRGCSNIPAKVFARQKVGTRSGFSKIFFDPSCFGARGKLAPRMTDVGGRDPEALLQRSERSPEERGARFQAWNKVGAREIVLLRQVSQNLCRAGPGRRRGQPRVDFRIVRPHEFPGQSPGLRMIGIVLRHNQCRLHHTVAASIWSYSSCDPKKRMTRTPA